jgi:soluble lytic murein transglycosylase-like protein
MNLSPTSFLALPIMFLCLCAIQGRAGGTIALSRTILDRATIGPTCKSDGTDAMEDPESPPDVPGMCALPAEIRYERGTEYPGSVREKSIRWARVFGIPASWPISQAYAESRNRPTVKNRSGATGVLQIKLARAVDLVTWLRRSRWGTDGMVREILGRAWHGLRDDLLDMDLNIMLACFDLRHLAGKFGHDHRLVAAAYNQGEGRIGRCLRDGIPFPRRAVEYIARVEDAKRQGYV